MHYENEVLLDVKWKSLLHLQCHFSQDTLSWGRGGVKYTDVDISAKAIKLTIEINEK